MSQYTRRGLFGTRCRQSQDHALTLPTHVRHDCFARYEKRSKETIDWLHEFLQRQVYDQSPLIVHDAHSIESDVDATRFRCNCIRMLFDSPQVEGINLCGFDYSTCRGDVRRYNVKPRLCPPSNKDSRTFPGENARNGSTDGPASSVD